MLVAYKTLSIHHQSMFHDEDPTNMMMMKKIINLMGYSGLIIGQRLPSQAFK